MAVALVAVQSLLVVLLIVVPALSGWDKFRRWKPARKAVAISLGIGIGVVAFTQFKRPVWFHKADLPGALGGLSRVDAKVAWYERKLQVMPLEYLTTVVIGGLLLGFSLSSARRRKYAHVAGYACSFVALLVVSVLLKLGLWR